MQTKLYTLPDWQEVLQSIGWENAPTEQDIERVITQELTRGCVTFAQQPADQPIENGCRVTLKTESVLPKFNREKTTLTVGSRLYDAGLEAQLCGLTEGQSLHTQVRGEPVKATVLKVERKVYPPLSDALVENLQLEGIRTLSAYRSHMEQKIKGEYASSLCQKLLNRLLSGAEMDQPAQEDVLAVIDCEYAPLRIRFSLDGMTPEAWAESFGNESLKAFYSQIYPDVANLFGTTGKESYYESRKEAAADTIRTCLVLRSILDDQRNATDPTQTLHARETLMRSMQDRLINMIYGGE